ncbi:membrane-bound lytic murein transglycosylase MltC [Candidatus Profftia tarda]|nr:membrane-bound lytic murein transglycosylase MltC [Candidatus Profftia tarda]
MKKVLVLILIFFLLIACSAKQDTSNSEILVKDINGLDILMGQFAHNIEKIWGVHQLVIAGPKDYVKYIDQYLTRSHINFRSGKITIETISLTHPLASLKEAIIKTLLMGANPDAHNLYSDLNITDRSHKPFLYNQVLDNYQQAIRWHGQASNFANYLLHHKLIRRKRGPHDIYSVNIALVPNHLDKRAHKYLSIVHMASKRYGIDESLILAIIQAESSFNPYAISSSKALGLMQIVQSTAGKDVFLNRGKKGAPSTSYLFNPSNNIDIGTAYLAILQNKYLCGISNPISRRYAVITAYNEGAGSVLRLFSNDRNSAISFINKLKPSDVYQRLISKNTSRRSDHYLYKVNNVHKRYSCRL